MGVKPVVRNRAQLEAGQPCIYIANHQSNVDLFILGNLLPKNTVTIGKKSIRRVPLFGWFYWLAGQVLIDRSNSERALATMHEAQARILREGLSVWIFPEGTRSHDKGLLPFKKGAFHMAAEMGLPVQPFAVSSLYRFVDFGRWKSGPVLVEVLAPIPTKGIPIDVLTETAHARMKEAVDRLNAELAAKV
jgi:1-acyl-sn-glycerol-3-phosphate acyltransferase